MNEEQILKAFDVATDLNATYFPDVENENCGTRAQRRFSIVRPIWGDITVIGALVFSIVSYGPNKGKFGISYSFPTADLSRAYYGIREGEREALTIYASAEKTPKQIVSDIERRLMPAIARSFVKAGKIEAARNERKEGAKANAEAINRANPDFKLDVGQTDADYQVTLGLYRQQGGETHYGNMKVSAKSATIEIRSDPEMALVIAKAVKKEIDRRERAAQPRRQNSAPDVALAAKSGARDPQLTLSI